MRDAAASARRLSASREHDRQPHVVLGHHRRFPAAAAAFVQQVGQRVFIFTRALRQLEDHCLVFFHEGENSSISGMTTTPALPGLSIVRHPLVQHKLSILRDRRTPTKIFKELVDEIAMLMAYEA